ncbi:MAG: hypothetical protein GWP59_02330 [Chlamydiales bacterium]|nr:hypothetical protein [Chlamydiales bacterium]
MTAAQFIRRKVIGEHLLTKPIAVVWDHASRNPRVSKSLLVVAVALTAIKLLSNRYPSLKFSNLSTLPWKVLQGVRAYGVTGIYRFKGLPGLGEVAEPAHLDRWVDELTGSGVFSDNFFKMTGFKFMKPDSCLNHCAYLDATENKTYLIDNFLKPALKTLFHYSLRGEGVYREEASIQEQRIIVLTDKVIELFYFLTQVPMDKLEREVLAITGKGRLSKPIEFLQTFSMVQYDPIVYPREDGVSFNHEDGYRRRFIGINLARYIADHIAVANREIDLPGERERLRGMTAVEPALQQLRRTVISTGELASAGESGRQILDLAIATRAELERIHTSLL